MQDSSRLPSRARSPRALALAALAGVAAIVVLATIARRLASDSEPREPAPDRPAHAAALTDDATTAQTRDVAAGEVALVATPDADSARTAAPASAEVPGAEEPLLQLVVATRESLAATSKVVPGIAVAAGLGAPFDATRAPLAVGRTGSDGLTTLAIPWSAVESARARGDALWLRVVEPGYQQRTRLRKLPDAPGPLDIAAMAYRGCTLRGRVLDTAGSPVAAKVRACAWLGERGMGYGGLADARPDGWFELLPYAPGSFQIVVDAGDLGTAALRDLAILPEHVHDPIELVVRGPGVVRGRVSDGARRPVAGIDLEVLAADFDRARDEPAAEGAAPGARRLGELELEGRGRVHVEVRTDANGVFEVLGLRDDLYVVRAPDGRGPGAALTPSPVPSDGEPLELVLARPHIAVEIVDEKGAPWIAPKPDPRRKRSSAGWSFGDPPPEALLAIAPMLEDLPSGMSSEAWIDTKDLGAGRHAADVVAGHGYWVGLLGVSQPWRPVRVAVPEGAGRVDVRIVALDPKPPGVIVVDMRSAAGESLTRGIAIRVEDPASGCALVDRDEFYGETFPLRLELPEGQYRVVGDGAPFVDNHHGVLLTPRALGRAEALVRVTSGGEIGVALQLAEGARLRLRLAGQANAADRAAVEAKYRGYSFGEEDWREVHAARATILLRSDGNRPVDVLFTEEWTGSSAAGTHLSRELALGKEDVSQVLPAGRFTLEAWLPGGRVARAPVTLVDGQTTAIALAFD